MATTTTKAHDEVLEVYAPLGLSRLVPDPLKELGCLLDGFHEAFPEPRSVQARYFIRAVNACLRMYELGVGTSKTLHELHELSGRAIDSWTDVETRRSRAAAGRAKGAAAARASPVLADLRAQRAQEKAGRYAKAVDWQRKHPRGRPHQLAKYLGVRSTRTLRRILRGR